MQSEFAKCLTELLDQSGIFDRRSWSIYLGVSQREISSWLNDKSIPKARSLRSILRCVEGSDDVPREIISKFHAMSSKPLRGVSPKHNLFGSTSIAEYIVRPRLETIVKRLSRLSIKEQEILLDLLADKIAGSEKF